MHILDITEGPRCPICHLLEPHDCVSPETVVLGSSSMALTVDDGNYSDEQERAWLAHKAVSIARERARKASGKVRSAYGRGPRQSNDHPWKKDNRAMFAEFKSHRRASR